ncbi:MAG: hypothetical protein LKG48_10110 [Lachnospiraceae bacterium]|jgi:hypothetical protein|nr:hypothetical protein [Lachnospiraceae bacterium]MCH4063626.1 hypothetical protein [Lachnospiraceae bacterium]MCH4103651.1 hypothetical protein [Lachnospiraceae bacterium]MCI1310097.1 hypothetical protein [Lachnospiraceae bacterium]MCI1334539.1 hypothetical protein [Lachnospiraceae bacterium]
MGSILNQLGSVETMLTGLDTAPKALLLAVGLLLALIYCFSGYTSIKAIGALFGFVFGLAIGFIIVGVMGLSSPLDIAVPAICGIVMAMISFFLFKLGVFFAVAFAGVWLVKEALAYYPALSDDATKILIAMCAGAALGVIGVLTMRHFIIVMTAIFGGIAFSKLIFDNIVLITWDSQVGTVLRILLAAGLAIAGMAHQFKTTGK